MVRLECICVYVWCISYHFVGQRSVGTSASTSIEMNPQDVPEAVALQAWYVAIAFVFQF